MFVYKDKYPDTYAYLHVFIHICFLPHHLTHSSRQLLWNYITDRSPPPPVHFIPPSPPQCVGCWRRAKHATAQMKRSPLTSPAVVSSPQGPQDSHAACALVLHCIIAGMLLLLLLRWYWFPVCPCMEKLPGRSWRSRRWMHSLCDQNATITMSKSILCWC